jgi:hypothetical protein
MRGLSPHFDNQCEYQTQTEKARRFRDTCRCEVSFSKIKIQIAVSNDSRPAKSESNAKHGRRSRRRNIEKCGGNILQYAILKNGLAALRNIRPGEGRSQQGEVKGGQENEFLAGTMHVVAVIAERKREGNSSQRARR